MQKFYTGRIYSNPLIPVQIDKLETASSAKTQPGCGLPYLENRHDNTGLLVYSIQQSLQLGLEGMAEDDLSLSSGQIFFPHLIDDR
jgi:hypothetical protein